MYMSDESPPEHSDNEYTEDYILYLEGTDAYYNGEYEKALELLLKSAQLYEHFKTYERLYGVLHMLYRDDEAFVYIEKSHRLNPRNNKTTVLYAEALVRQKRIDEAKTVLSQMLSRNATYGPAKKLLAKLTS
jgi:pentatricopeptide repeat protein